MRSVLLLVLSAFCPALLAGPKDYRPEDDLPHPRYLELVKEYPNCWLSTKDRAIRLTRESVTPQGLHFYLHNLAKRDIEVERRNRTRGGKILAQGNVVVEIAPHRAPVPPYVVIYQNGDDSIEMIVHRDPEASLSTKKKISSRLESLSETVDGVTLSCK